MAGKQNTPLKDKKKIQEGREEFQNIRKFAKKYIGSPGFNQRLNARLKELNNDQSITRSHWNVTLNPNYLDNTILNLWEGDGSSWANSVGNTLNMTERGMGGLPKKPGRHTMAHEIGHLIDNGVIKIYSAPFYLPTVKSRIQYSSIYPQLRSNKEAREAIKAGIRPDSTINKDAYDIIYSKNKDDYHDAFEQEPYADFFQMRYELDRLGLYDSTKANNPFTKEILDKFRKYTNSGQGVSGRYPYTMAIKRIFDNFKEDQIIEIMNKVAEVDPSKQLKEQLSPDPNQAYYAKRGIRLIKKPKHK